MKEPTDVRDAQAEFDAIGRELARRRYLGFVTHVNPHYEVNWHHARLAQELDEVVAGRTKRLMVFMPPQMGKSEQISRTFPAYVLGRHPETNIVAASYSSDLIQSMSRDVQRVMSTPEYRTLFPGVRLAESRDDEVRRQDEFVVVGHRGGYIAAGVGKGISGRPMHLGIIDDPYPGRNDAESEAWRRTVWNWYVGDFTARMSNEHVPIVIVQTRWRTDDLCGALLKLAADNPSLPQWRVVKFKAVAEGEMLAGDPRQVGDALWPNRWSRKALDAVKLEKGVYDWSAIYQQEPIPAGGAMAQREWFKIPDVPFVGAIRKCRCWDLAATVPTPGRDPDWSVGTLVAQLPGPDKTWRWQVEHVVRTRATPGAVDALMLQTAQMDGRSVMVREFQDPGQAGKSQISHHAAMLVGYDFAGLPQSGEKSTRWRPFLAQAEADRVTLVRGAWNRDWLDEMATIPYGAHDDQADSVSGGFNALVDVKDYGPSAAVILPSAQTDWRGQYFGR